MEDRSLGCVLRSRRWRFGFCDIRTSEAAAYHYSDELHCGEHAMTHEQLVEKVARAMWDAIPSDPDIEQNMMPYEELCAEYPCVMNDHLHQARAAIAAIAEALRVPSDAMTLAGAASFINDTFDVPGAEYWAANTCWRAMLTASALNPEGGKDEQ